MSKKSQQDFSGTLLEKEPETIRCNGCDRMILVVPVEPYEYHSQPARHVCKVQYRYIFGRAADKRNELFHPYKVLTS